MATKERKRFVFVAEEVERLAVNEIKSGNIIFDVLVRDHEEINIHDIQFLYGFQTDSAGENQGANLLEKVRLQKWKILEVNPSYGASCLILANSIEIISHADWILRYFQANKSDTILCKKLANEGAVSARYKCGT